MKTGDRGGDAGADWRLEAREDPVRLVMGVRILRFSLGGRSVSVLLGDK